MASEATRPVLSREQLAFLAEARTATLATISPSGRPRLVPVCFIVDVDATGGARIYTPIDEKPKRSTDPLELARVRDIRARPEVALLVDRWSEDWSQLAWLRLDGTGEVLDAGVPDSDQRAQAITALRTRYPQYGDHALESRPIIRIVVRRAIAWGAIGA